MQEAVQSHFDMKNMTESMTGFSDCRGCRKHVCLCRHFGGYEETKNPRGVTYVFKVDFIERTSLPLLKGANTSGCEGRPKAT